MSPCRLVAIRRHEKDDLRRLAAEKDMERLLTQIESPGIQGVYAGPTRTNTDLDLLPFPVRLW